jgi:phosphoribosylamine---glycine ligase
MAITLWILQVRKILNKIELSKLRIIMSLIKNENLIYQGSVKNIYQIDNEQYLFQFSDRYSIFDWGQMPDSIPEKGKSLAKMGRLFFEYLSKKTGIKNHLVRQANEHGITNYDGNNLIVKKVNVLKPFKDGSQYSYAMYQKPVTQTLVPLEVIFRLGAPVGSSLLSRKSNGQYYENQEFDQPLIEFSTKLEPIDRYLSADDARVVAGLNAQEFKNLIQLTSKLALELKELISKLNLKLWDGKFEFAFGEVQDGVRELILVDSIGIDELRITANGIHLSKEMLRQYYYDTKWYKQIKNYKLNFKDDWKAYMLKDQLSPLSLDNEFKHLTHRLYQAFANDLEFAINNQDPVELNAWLTDYANYQQKEKINILVVGHGGREHALCWRLLQSASTKHLFITDSHHAMLDEPGLHIFESKPNKSMNFITELQNHNIKLIVIGPEVHLVEGLSDYLREHGFFVFGPNQMAAMLESSKDFAKSIMTEANIPTAQYATFTDPNVAIAFIEQSDWATGHVIKMDGLASGKGVVVTSTKQDAINTIYDLMIKNSLNLDSTKVIIEERLIGKEVSVFALMDNTNLIYLADACDYKRIRDNDQGPNTGGMGTYSPCEWLSEDDRFKIQQTILQPLHQYLKKHEIDYNGVIFVGLMQTSTGIKVLEFNVRFGDPETQSILPRIKGDFARMLSLCAKNQLDQLNKIELEEKTCINVVCAAHGYPGTEGVNIRLYDPITITNNFSDNQKIFFAGCKREGDHLLTTGGRVLSLATWAKSKKEARNQLYESLKNIHFEGMQYRYDIGN